MKIEIIDEWGYEGAIEGLRLSYNTSIDKAEKVATSLYNKDGGHNKFLESIHIQVRVRAPRFWFSEADTYRLSSKQSQSTMHTLSKRNLTQFDFEYDIPSFYLLHLNDRIEQVRQHHVGIDLLKNDLPEGFLQTRIWDMSYKTLRNILQQRHDHKLPQWRQFCSYMLDNAEYVEFLKDLMKP